MKANTLSLVRSRFNLEEYSFCSEQRLAEASLPGKERQRYLALIKALKSGTPLKGASLVDTIRVLQIELLPELGTGFDHSEADYLDFKKFGGHYVYFAPSYAFDSGLMDEELLLQLYRNPQWKILSVGAGGAYLEKLLILIGAIGRENLLVSDLNAKDLPQDLDKVVFDMNKPWPALGRKFNIILFSESLCGIKPAVNLSSGDVFFENRWGEDMQWANLHYEGYLNVIDQALRFLVQGGQIRMTTQAGIGEHAAKFEQRLRQRGHCSVRVERKTPDGSLIVHAA